MNESNLVEALREKIEARYKESLHALDVLQNYLTECEVPEPPHVAAKPLEPTKCEENGSYRQRVLAVLGEKWEDIDSIARLSELQAKRVRGVLYATSLAQKIESRRENGRIVFRIKQ